jgi:hypothetical protein
MCREVKARPDPPLPVMHDLRCTGQPQRT